MTLENNDEYSELSLELTNKIDKKEKKSNGIFFTPPKTIHKTLEYLQKFMGKAKEVLEPSCGSCEYVLAINKLYPDINITGLELNETIFESITHLERPNVKLINENFRQN